jgi:hypothetical protein
MNKKNQPIMPYSALTTAEAAMILGALRRRFPWVGFDEPVSGADVVEDLGQMFEDLQERIKGDNAR